MAGVLGDDALDHRVDLLVVLGSVGMVAATALVGSAAPGRLVVQVDLRVHESPTRSGSSAISLGTTSMRTGTRCTILIQLPDTYCAGSNANAARYRASNP